MGKNILSDAMAESHSNGSRRWILVTLCLAVLVAQLDTSVVNLAVRPIQASFRIGIVPMQWVVDGYNLTYAVFLLSGGLLADLFGRRRALVAGAAVFTLASLLCAATPSVAVLIGGRVLAGFGAALLLPASLAIIRVVWADERERGRVLGIWTACNGLALAVGPAIGGALIGPFGWRSVFFVVVPIGVAALVLAVKVVPESRHAEGRRFDSLAQFLGVVALGGFTLAAIELDRAGWLAAAAFIAGAVAFVVFIHVEARRGAAALVPLALFRSRTFCSAVAATTGMTFGMYGVLFLLPLVWQADAGLGSVAAGLALMPMALVFVLVSPFSGALAERAGARAMSAGGIAIIGIGLLTIGLAAQASAFTPEETGLALTGLGMGLATGPLMGLGVGAVTADRAGTAAALINVARMVGATIGVALLGALFAAAGGGPAGLGLAMILGGGVQLVAGATAWLATRPAG